MSLPFKAFLWEGLLQTLNHISSDKPITHALKQKGQQFSVEEEVVTWDCLQKINVGFSQRLLSLF